MSSSPLASSILFITPILCFFSNSWMILWVLLEMNTLAFCSMNSLSWDGKSLFNMEVSMKYFIIQSVASAVFVGYLSFPSNSTVKTVLFLGGTAAIILKMAACPLQSWFVDMIKKSKWSSVWLLMTWQKLAPIYLILFAMKSVVGVSMIITALVGSISQMNKNKIMEILALSSIFNLSWMMMSSMLSFKTLLLFVSLYWTSLWVFFNPLLTMNYTTISGIIKSGPPLMVILAIASLAGMPPTAGFLAKWSVVIFMAKSELFVFVILFLSLSAINFYVYLRLMMSCMYSESETKQKVQIFKNRKNVGLAFILSSVPLMLFSLSGYAWMKSVILME